MKKHLMIPLFLCGFGAAVSLQAEERFDHFKGEPSETLEQAVTHFSTYNDKLAEVLERDDLEMADLVGIHELTYTLENALEKINEELAELTVVLEALHVASETADFEGTREHGRAYLDTARKVIP